MTTEAGSPTRFGARLSDDGTWVADAAVARARPPCRSRADSADEEAAVAASAFFCALAVGRFSRLNGWYRREEYGLGLMSPSAAGMPEEVPLLTVSSWLLGGGRSIRPPPPPTVERFSGRSTCSCGSRPRLSARTWIAPSAEVGSCPTENHAAAALPTGTLARGSGLVLPTACPRLPHRRRPGRGKPLPPSSALLSAPPCMLPLPAPRQLAPTPPPIPSAGELATGPGRTPA
jgi:hypothetical protein